LRKAALSAGTVQVKIRKSDFKTFTRQQQLRPPGDGTDRIYAVAREMLAKWLNDNPDARIRLLGVGCSSLAPAGQQDLFANSATSQATDFDRAVDEIRDRFGSDSVTRARTLDRP
jgi:DNA polymerase IV